MTNTFRTRPAPTGATHEVAVDEMFYSTTDATGHIDQVNPVFVDLSRYPAAELVGSPHNIVRHPAMPAGVFLLMWNTISAGKPFCGYIDNLGADGSTYSVFATMTPISDGYLSVRTRPCRPDLKDALDAVYAGMRTVEEAARAAGSSAHAAAEAGLERLGVALREHGMGSYGEFVLEVLPAEVAARLEAGAQPPFRPDAVGPFADMLVAARELRMEIAGWLGRTDELRSFTASLLHGIAQLQATLAECSTLGRELQGRPDRADLRGFASHMAGIEESRTGIVAGLATLRERAAASTFRIALASLHADLLGQAAADAIDNAQDPADVRAAATKLCRVVREGIQETTGTLASSSQLATTLAERIDGLADLPHVPLPDEGDISPFVERALRLVRRADADVALLRDLADRCRAMASPLPVGPAEAALSSIDLAVGAL